VSRSFQESVGVLMHKKSNLEKKLCLSCGRPFSWRKKWQFNWTEV